MSAIEPWVLPQQPLHLVLPFCLLPLDGPDALRVLHGVPTITPGVTAGAVYILRNPLDIVLSYADHYGLSHTETVDAISSAPFAIYGLTLKPRRRKRKILKRIETRKLRSAKKKSPKLNKS